MIAATPEDADRLFRYASSVFDGLGDSVALEGSPEQTEVLLVSAATDELAAGQHALPGGYIEAATRFRPGLTFYKFSYVEPGAQRGMAYDGLVHVGGRWVFVPKMWRAFS